MKFKRNLYVVLKLSGLTALVVLVLSLTVKNDISKETTGNAGLKKINILFLMADQHRGDCIGAAGAKHVHTPNLDLLAKEGILFTRAYSSVPSCLPARTSILTGMSP